MPINYLALGKRIAFFRNKSHLTQDDLADRLNMSRTFLARIETSSRHPSLETIVELASVDELAVLDGGKCILQLRGVRPFLSEKYDITKHPNYKYLSDADWRNTFDIEKFLSTKLKVKPEETYDSYEVAVTEESSSV